MPTLTIQKVVELTGGETEGDLDRIIERVSPLDEAGPHDLSFLVGDDPKDAEISSAGAILVARDLEGDASSWIRVDNPYYAFSQVLREWFWTIPAPEGVSERSSIASSANLGSNVRIGPWVTVGEGAVIGDDVIIREGCSIGERAQIGKKSVLFPGVTLYQDVRIGERCILHANTVIGSDGFGFATHEGAHHKIPQIGSVEIEDDVEIGAGTTVDRGTLNDTIIRSGTKIDNLVMIAHNVEIGRHCFLAAQTGIAGSTIIGDYCALGGQSGVVGHIRLGDQVMVAAKSAVMKSFDGPITLAGIPARPLRETRRSEAATRRIPEMIKRLAELESVVNETVDSKKG
ncbi:MAG: UDP-3-O-(3-hydroxymyristoyl)glucosamine N-acyltransferase [Thermoanaerobaculia bacterium]|nr:UDP-3-O-(3-hydroxymyristoyl)glucosamine N-acyltransferase [Thermoanaerobaculia bacterium]